MKTTTILLLFILAVLCLWACMYYFPPRYLPITIIGYTPQRSNDVHLVVKGQLYEHANNIPESLIKENMENNIQILNLVLYSTGSEEYDHMKRITEEYYKNFTNVKTVYYAFSETIDTPYRLDNNVLFIKGKESYIPGITDKTKAVFSYFKDEYNNYDYIVRSNISTIINFDLLTNELSKEPIDYGSGLTFSLQSHPVENTDEKIYGVNFASGTSIILSKRVMQRIVEKVDLMRNDIIDDVSIGVFIKDYLPDIKMKQIVPDKYTFVPNYQGDYAKIYNHVKEKDYIFYRNRTSDDRKIDGKQMSQIVQIIS